MRSLLPPRPSAASFNLSFSDEKQDSDDGNSNERIIINVSGLRFETQVGTLNKFQNSLLGDATRRKKYYDMDFEIERIIKLANRKKDSS